MPPSLYCPALTPRLLPSLTQQFRSYVTSGTTTANSSKKNQHFPRTAGSSGGTRCSVMFKRASEKPLPASPGHHRPESLQPVAPCRQREEAAGPMGTSTMNLSHPERSCFRSSHMKSANCSELDSFCKTVFAFVPI